MCAVFDILCENMLKCVVFISDGHYTESGNSSVSDEGKGRCTHETRVSYLRRREMCLCNARLISEEKGDTSNKHTSPFYLTA
jgi:hypothetical protein